jgi:hypothetical protein
LASDGARTSPTETNPQSARSPARNVSARLRERSTVLALILAAVIAIVAFVGVNQKETATPPTSYAFDSRYEVVEAEGRVNEAILRREMNTQRSKYGGEFGVKTTHCVVSPPPPTANRLICRVLTVAQEVRPRITIARFYRWRVLVRMNPTTGALALEIHGPSDGTRPLVTP